MVLEHLGEVKEFGMWVIVLMGVVLLVTDMAKSLVTTLVMVVATELVTEPEVVNDLESVLLLRRQLCAHSGNRKYNGFSGPYSD